MRHPVVFLMFLLSLSRVHAVSRPENRNVSWTSPDGVVFIGKLMKPAGKAQAGWVLLHGLGSVKEEWGPLAEKLSKSGVAVLAMDLRGHGGSTRTSAGQTLSYSEFRPGRGSNWEKMVGDIGPAVDQLAKETGLPKSRIGLAGASLGANLAMNYAAAHPEVPALLLLSPGMEYAGIAIEKPFKVYGNRPLFLAASPGDLYAFSSVQALARTRRDAAMRLAAGDGAAHGVQMFSPAFLMKVVDWCTTAIR